MFHSEQISLVALFLIVEYIRVPEVPYLSEVLAAKFDRGKRARGSPLGKHQQPLHVCSVETSPFLAHSPTI